MIKKVEVAMYGFAVSSGEMFTEVMKGGERIKKLFDEKKPYVYQDRNNGDNIFLYRTIDDRNKYYNMAIALGFRAFPVVNTIFVDAKYLRDDD